MNKREFARLLARFEPDIRDAVLGDIASMVDGASLSDLTIAVESADIDRIMILLGDDFPRIRLALTGAYGEAGILEAQGLTRGSTIGRILFSLGNPRAQQFLAEQSSGLITNIAEDVRENIRRMLDLNVGLGNNPRQTALDIVGRVNNATGRREGGIVGLTTNQSTWAESAREQLESLDSGYFGRKLRDRRFDSTIRKAIEAKKPLDTTQIRRVLNAYKRRLLKLRGNMIARTESIRALNAGRYEALAQLVENQGVEERHISLKWDTTGDFRVRDLHVAMDEQKRTFGQPFTSPTGARLRYPGDSALGASGEDTINCRCFMEQRVSWIAIAAE